MGHIITKLRQTILDFIFKGRIFTLSDGELMALNVIRPQKNEAPLQRGSSSRLSSKHNQPLPS